MKKDESSVNMFNQRARGLKYMVDCGIPGAVPNCNTVEDLNEYLNKNPFPAHRLASCMFVSGNFILVWERTVW
jgi:hypothetical protein